MLLACCRRELAKCGLHYQSWCTQAHSNITRMCLCSLPSRTPSQVHIQTYIGSHRLLCNCPHALLAWYTKNYHVPEKRAQTVFTRTFVLSGELQPSGGGPLSSSSSMKFCDPRVRAQTHRNANNKKTVRNRIDATYLAQRTFDLSASLANKTRGILTRTAHTTPLTC